MRRSISTMSFVKVLAALAFAAYAGECIAQTSRADQALELLRAALACVPSVDDGGHSGISTGYSKVEFQGNSRVLVLTSVDTMVLGTVTDTYSARFQDLDDSQTMLVANSTLGLGCRNQSSCIQLKRTVRCNSGFDCIESNQLGLSSSPVVQQSISFADFYLCDRKTALDAKLAMRILELGPSSSAPIPQENTVKPFFDCGKAETLAENAVCADASLATKDLRLNELYKDALRSASGKRRSDLVKAETNWRVERDNCGRAVLLSCVGELYDHRIEELRQR